MDFRYEFGWYCRSINPSKYEDDSSNSLLCFTILLMAKAADLCGSVLSEGYDMFGFVTGVFPCDGTLEISTMEAISLTEGSA